jgi:hypothetical protein
LPLSIYEDVTQPFCGQDDCAAILQLDVKPDGYVNVLVDSPSAICHQVHVDPQPQNHESVQLSIAATDSAPLVLESSNHRSSNKKEPGSAEVGGMKKHTRCHMMSRS